MNPKPIQDRHLRFSGLRKGRVEARQDPLKQGRLKVRVEGVHGEQVAVQHLPWALPKMPAWRGGGLWAVPPLNSTVWIEFESTGDQEYPVWSGGLWSQDDVIEIENPLRMAWFGSENTHAKGGILQPDPVKSDPRNSPNSFWFTSPLQKTLWMDDRKDRECVFLSDQIGNSLFVNTENGVATIGVVKGLQGDEDKPRGLTFASDVTNELQAWQFFSDDGWLVGQDDLKKDWYVHSPSGFILSVSEERGMVEIETPSGVRLSVRETGVIDGKTPGGLVFELSDPDQRVLLKNNESVCLISPTDVEFYCPGNFRVSAGAEIKFISGTDIKLDALGTVQWQTNPGVITPPDITIQESTPIEEKEKLPASYEFSAYRDPVKSGGSESTPTA